MGDGGAFALDEFWSVGPVAHAISGSAMSRRPHFIRYYVTDCEDWADT